MTMKIMEVRWSDPQGKPLRIRGGWRIALLYLIMAVGAVRYISYNGDAGDAGDADDDGEACENGGDCECGWR